MKRVLAAFIALPAGIVLLSACSDDAKPGAATAVSTGGGNTEVSVDGKPLDGLDLNSVTCVKQGGRISIGSAAINGQQGVSVVMTDAATPTVEALSLFVDGNALGVANTGPAKSGSATVSVDGKTYTITGEATGADLKNPLAGPISKPYTIKVSCG